MDVLLAVDNSPTMADKGEVLAYLIPDLLERLVNPRCIDRQNPDDPADDIFQDPPPATPLDGCHPGFSREFEPILDIHVGVISTSLGGHGADTCSPASPSFHPHQADMAHLVTRTLAGGDVPTYEGLGFLAWDPEGALAPPGEANFTSFRSNMHEMVMGVGQNGCEHEAPLESWYRFLVDPDPHESISIDANHVAVPQGTDDVILAQRRDFLRPNSLLAIVMITDENDCSIADHGQNWYAMQATSDGAPFVLPRGTSSCEFDPNDPCCRSCAINYDPPGCPPLAEDPSCQASQTPVDDPLALRCWQQKRRFGLDFMWPVHRYINGLKSQMVKNRNGIDTQNPIFSDLQARSGVSQRDPSLVVLTGILGVPWQDIARDPTDLSKGYMTAAELTEQKRWDVILGDPDSNIEPGDPLMIESIAPRMGTHPITGYPLKPPDAETMANPINGHERNIVAKDDLQYACIFDLPTPRDCTMVGSQCDCKGGDDGSNNPLCQDASTGAYGTTQWRGKAYPAVRQLQVLRGIGDQAIVGSICPVEMQDRSRADHGYRPVVSAIVARLGLRLSGRCLPRIVEVTSGGQAACTVVEARLLTPGETCDCTARAREPLGPEDAALARYIVDPESGGLPSDTTCLCKISQLAGTALEACQNDPQNPPYDVHTGEHVHGFCYVDPELGLGSEEFVEKCDENERRMIRFAGAGRGKAGAWVFIDCGELAASASNCH